MKNEIMYKAIREMVLAYGRENDAETAAADLLEHPAQWLESLHPVFQPAALALQEILADMDTKNAGRERLAAIKRILRALPEERRKRYGGIWKCNGRYALCNGYIGLRLGQDLPSLPHLEECSMDLDRCIPDEIGQRRKLALPSIAQIKAEIAKTADRKKTTWFCLDNAAWVDARLLLDIMQALPGCVAYAPTPDNRHAIYFRGENGDDGVLMGLRPPEDWSPADWRAEAKPQPEEAQPEAAPEEQAEDQPQREEPAHFLDSNGREITLGAIVEISGAYFKNDNGRYFVERTPGAAGWTGKDLCLCKIGRNGKISTAKYRLAFWPLKSFANDRTKCAQADAWNREHAKITLTSVQDMGEVVGYFAGLAEERRQQLKEQVRRWGADTVEACRLRKEIAFYQATADRLRAEGEAEAKAEPAKTPCEDGAGVFLEGTEEPAATEEPPRVEEPPTEAAKPRYYAIHEDAARRAKEAMSFSDYKPGSATAEYQSMVDKAAEIARQQKKRVDPSFHGKIDGLLDAYARKLAENRNHGYEIAARVPSVMIAGGSNFPVRKKQKQNAAYDKNMREWQEIQGLLDKIRSTGMSGISADDPDAVSKLQSKLEKREALQETMKAVNAYYRKHKTLDGCPDLTPETRQSIETSWASGWYTGIPFPPYELSNNNAEIHRLKERIASLSRQKETGYSGWEFDGGKVEANAGENRLQIFFDDIPPVDLRNKLKSHGFRWSPQNKAWQRQLTPNAQRDARAILGIA